MVWGVNLRSSVLNAAVKEPEVMNDTPSKSCCTPSRDQSGDESDRLVGLTLPVAKRGTDKVTRDMVELTGGEFLMGSEGPEAWQQDGEGPVRKVTVDPFWIDRCAVSVKQFATFVEATGYVTESERFGWSFVFHLHVPKKRREELRREQAVAGLEWWLAVPGANWKQPFGPDAGVDEQHNHPVTQVTWNDAAAYCRWAGKRLPAEAEWEFAARGGRARTIWPWGDSFPKHGKHRCNIFQGNFPKKDTGADGYTGTCPVDAFEPNDFGLFNVVGNVWEWCQDWFSPDYHRLRPDLTTNPTGPPSGTKRSQRGGSYLCHDSYCNRYRLSARIGNTPDSSGSNSGFRCAYSRSEEECQEPVERSRGQK